MDQAMVDRVRRFSRAVTARVGALEDHYLSRDLALGEARLLWEIGPDGDDVRELRSRLDLDSGYTSRLLRSLEAAGLVDVEPHDDDKRVRTATLSAAGLRERAVLDERSDALAWSFLAPLSADQRTRLTDAMATVERLLTAGLVELSIVDPAEADAVRCVQQYFAEIDQRFDTGFDPTITPSLDVHRPPSGLFIVARLRDEPIGCGGLAYHDPEPPDIKRMWVAPSTRGLGVGRRLLSELERLAAERGHDTIRLETNRVLTEAIAMYRSAGYVEVDPFNDEPHAHHWFAKRLPSPNADPAST
jgi:DNA-binding MarR family transcriptional regulator